MTLQFVRPIYKDNALEAQSISFLYLHDSIIILAKVGFNLINVLVYF